MTSHNATEACLLRIGQVRAEPVKGDLNANFRTLTNLLERTDNGSCDVIVTSECFLDGYISTEEHVTADDLRDYAIDPAIDPRVATLADHARRLNAWIIFGCLRREGDAIFNTALVINRNGAIVGSYDKTHCQRHDRKHAPGAGLPVFDSEFGRFGVLICADRRWPETVRSLALQGARVIFNPTYGMACDLNLAMMRTRAYESEVFIAFTHPRQSLVTDPAGNVLCDERQPGPALAVTAINLADVDAARLSPSAHLRDRRPDIYTL